MEGDGEMYSNPSLRYFSAQNAPKTFSGRILPESTGPPIAAVRARKRRLSSRSYGCFAARRRGIEIRGNGGNE